MDMLDPTMATGEFSDDYDDDDDDSVMVFDDMGRLVDHKRYSSL